MNVSYIYVMNMHCNLIFFYYYYFFCLSGKKMDRSNRGKTKMFIWSCTLLITHLIHANDSNNKCSTDTCWILETSFGCISCVHFSFPTCVYSEIVQWKLRLSITLDSGGTSINILEAKGKKTLFGKERQDPQRDISFDHFEHEKAHFFLVSVKSGGKLANWGGISPMPNPHATSGW